MKKHLKDLIKIKVKYVNSSHYEIKIIRFCFDGQ